MHNRLDWQKQLVRAAMCAITVLALAQDALPAAEGPVLPGTALWALAAGAAWTLYGALLKLRRPFAPARLAVLAAALAGVVALGQSFAAVGTAELVTGRLMRTGLVLAGYALLVFAAMRLLLEALSTPREAREQRFPLPGPAPVWLGALLLACWLPWYVCLYPGTVSNDSISQLKEIMGLVPMSNANPVFQTWLLGAFRQAGLWLGSADAGVALYCVTQAVLMAWLLGTLLDGVRRSAAPRWLFWTALVFYALCPIFPVFAFCVGKDTNFAMAVLFLSLMVKRVVEEPGRRGAARAAGLCAAAVLCALLRNPGIFLALLTLALLLAWTLRRRLRRETGAWRLPALAAACVLVVYGGLHLMVLPGLNIAPMPESENYSLPLQQVARVAAGGGLTEEQAEAVAGVLPVEELKVAYNGELSDPVKALWREDATPEQKRAFWRAWTEIVMDHPVTCLSATFHNTYGYLYPGYMSVIKPTLLIGDQSTRTASVKGLYDYTVNPLSERLEAFTGRLAQNPLYRLVVSPGLYGWIVLMSAVWLLRGNRGRLLCAVPAVFTLAGCLLSAVNGYFRYAMPLYLCAPLLLWLTAKGREQRQR